MSTESELIEAVKQVAAEYHVGVNSVWLRTNGKELTFDLEAMPVLPFFVALSDKLRVPLASIAVECRAYASGGCPTCGPEVELDITACVTLN